MKLHCIVVYKVHNHLKKDSHYLSKDFGDLNGGLVSCMVV